MQLIHEHLLGSGFTATAAMLQKEADLAPLPLTAALLPVHQVPALEASSVQQPWPSGRVQGFLSDKANVTMDQSANVSDSVLASSKKKALTFSSSFSQRTQSLNLFSGNRTSSTPKSPLPTATDTGDAEMLHKTPLSLPHKRKLGDMKDVNSASVAKHPATADQAGQSSVFQTPAPTRRCLSVVVDSPTAFYSGRTIFNNISTENMDNSVCTPGLVATTAHPGVNDHQSGNLERMTLDSMVVQYLKHQHRQCPAPVTTLPPLPLLHPHVCPEPSRSLSAPGNIATRMESREVSKQFTGIQIPRRDRHFIYSRFKQCRVCRDESSLLTCMTFLGDASRVAAGNHTGELRLFDCNTAELLDTQACHQHHVAMMESAYSGGNELILTSSINEVKIWDAFSISGGSLHTFEGCKAAKFSHSGALFAALSADGSQREVQLYDVQTYNLDLRLPDSSTNSGSGRSHIHPLIHFSPDDSMLLWNGVLWDIREPKPVHQFDQFTDYCGGGFHPAGNEVHPPPPP
jgi:DDB1- and CUL4-associated factor 1